MKSLNFFAILIISYFFTYGLDGQEVISYQKVKTMTKQEIQGTLFIPAKYDVDVYNIIYTSKKLNFKKDTASGILAVAKNPAFKFPVAVYDHGTVGNRDEVPSKGSDEQFIAIAIASYGYHCVAPDYIGLGISKGIHPYVNPESEAWASIDLINASYSLSGAEPFYFNDQVFVTGYSQGGHAAMATAFAIEQRKIKHVDSMVLTAAAPMSGPYSISREMKAFTMGDEEYFFCAYLGSVFLSAKEAHFDLLDATTVEDIFKPEFASLVRKFESETLDLFEVNDIMISLLSENGGKVLPKRMFRDEVRDDILTNPNNPLQLALERMDICNWVPLAPIKMIYCKADDQVTYRNTIYTDSLMKVNGALKVSIQDVLSSGDHGQCFYPALLNMITFFNSFQKIDPFLSVGNLNDEIQIWPNPASNVVNISNLNKINQGFEISLFDCFGNELKQTVVKAVSDNFELKIADIPSGIYIMSIIDENGVLGTKKLSVIK